MKKIILIVLTFILLIVNTQEINASHTVGGEITYRCINTNTGTYRIRLICYRDCSGIQFGAEQIQIFGGGHNTSVTMNLISAGIDVTPICRPPDVTTAPTTNCPSGPVGSNGIKGFDKWVYEVDYTVGNDKGYVIFGWTTCCRNAVINTGQANCGIWIQSAVNTDYRNNSVVFTTRPLPRWCKSTSTTYNYGAIDSFDAKFVSLSSGKLVVRDSISYERIPAFQSRAANATDAFNLNNTPCPYAGGLDKNNFLYTTASGPVTLNPTTGSLTCTPSIVQDVVLSFVAKEHRAVPNSNGGYTRANVGHVCRDIQFTVRDVCNPITVIGVYDVDPSSYISANRVIAKSNPVQVKMKVFGATGQSIIVADNSTIDPSYIKNYSFGVQKVTVGGVDTASITFNFRKEGNISSYPFKFKVYYCTSAGMVIEKYVDLTVDFLICPKFVQDTVKHCVGSPFTQIYLNDASSVSWSPQSSIVSSNLPDSTWVNVNPSSSQWYYADNYKSNDACKQKDSIYVQVDTCQRISGYLFRDRNGNCTKNLGEDSMSNTIINYSTSSGISNTIYTNSAGYYNFNALPNTTYTISSLGMYFNCSTNPNQYTINTSTTNLTVNIPAKDTIVVNSFSLLGIDTSGCVVDTQKIKYSFYKSEGVVIAVLKYSPVDSIIDTVSMVSGLYEWNKKIIYRLVGNYQISITIRRPNNQLLLSRVLASNLSMSSCIFGNIFKDVDTNCIKSTGDINVNYSKVNIKNISTSQTQYIFSDYQGYFRTKINPSNSYILEFALPSKCPSLTDSIGIPSTTSDTSYMLSIPFHPSYYNYKISVGRIGAVSNTQKLRTTVNVHSTQSINKVFKITMPQKAKLDTVLGATSYSKISNILTVNAANSIIEVRYRFDSLVATDTLCFHYRLMRIGQEYDTADNEYYFCAPAFTSYDPNNKLSAIRSQDNKGNFTNKSDYIQYTVNFQNTGNAEAKDVRVTDVLSPKLDINTMQVLDASHNMNIVMDDNRMVHFEFKNIMLADSVTDEPASHGYFNFIIKPIATLVPNDLIQNSANIYFDFNSPILTNTAMNRYIVKSIVDTVGKDSTVIKDTISGKDTITGKDSTMSVVSIRLNQLSTYPNPVSDRLYVQGIEKGKSYSIEILNIRGQMIRRYENISVLDVHDIETGVYILHYHSAENSKYLKFLKE